MGDDRTATGPVGGRGVGGVHAGPLMARMQLGHRLRGLRESRGITREEAGEAIRGSDSKISRLELGRTGFKRRDVVDLLALYGVSDEIACDELLALVEPSNTPGWVHKYSDLLPGGDEMRLELEQGANLIRCYEAAFVPDLLQTDDYARAVIALEYPYTTDLEVERRVALVKERQRILARPEPARLWAVIDEAALRRRIDGPKTMRLQLEHLIDLVERHHVTVQVVPFSTGVAAAGPITVLRFAELDLTDLVYLGPHSNAPYFDKPAIVGHYKQVMDRLGIQADVPAAADPFLREVLTQY